MSREDLTLKERVEMLEEDREDHWRRLRCLELAKDILTWRAPCYGSMSMGGPGGEALNTQKVFDLAKRIEQYAATGEIEPCA